MLIDQHPGGSGNDAAPAAADGRACADNGALDTRYEGNVGALVLKLSVQIPPFGVELGGGVLSVVRVFEIDRSERTWRFDELSESFRTHDHDFGQICVTPQNGPRRRQGRLLRWLPALVSAPVGPMGPRSAAAELPRQPRSRGRRSFRHHR